MPNHFPTSSPRFKPLSPIPSPDRANLEPDRTSCHRWGQRRHTGEQVAAYLAVGNTVTHGLDAHSLFVLAQSEPIFHLPAIQMGLDDLGCSPVPVVGVDDRLAEPFLFPAQPVEVIAEAQRQVPAPPGELHWR